MLKLDVLCVVDDAHAVLAELLEDLVVADSAADQDGSILALSGFTRITSENKRYSK